MGRFFRVAVVVATMASSLAVVNSAQGSGETASIDSTLTLRSGALYSDVAKPGNWHFEAIVTAPHPANATVLPVKQVKVTLPADAQLQPDDSVTPACNSIASTTPSDKSTDEAIELCPTSVLGNGSGVVHLVGNNSPELARDMEITAFNGGANGGGNSTLKLWAYTPTVDYGFLIGGVLQSGRLDLSVPVLQAESAVGALELNFPGTDAPISNRRGLDPGIVQAKCATGTRATSAQLILGTRDSAGMSTSPEKTLSPNDSEACTGAVAPNHEMSITKTGNGGGVITSEPAGINCGATCSVSFSETTEVALTADPDGSSDFGGWSGGDCPDTGLTCKVTMLAAQDIGAAFTPKPTSGPVGVSINDGQKYTNDPDVTIFAVWPAGESLLTISNDGGFKDGQKFDLKAEIDWSLDSSGPERLPKTVYARLGDSTQTMTDDIILDETNPSLNSVSATSSGRRGSSSSVRSLAEVSRKRNAKKVILKTKASDRTSGVAKIQVGPKKSKNLKKLRYKKRIKVKTTARVLWVRVIDRAGNSSRWKKARIREK